jgi:hypothetical protein
LVLLSIVETTLYLRDIILVDSLATVVGIGCMVVSVARNKSTIRSVLL